MNKRSRSSLGSGTLILTCFLLSACAENRYRTADRSYCTDPNVCRHQAIYEEKTNSEIVADFSSGTPRIRAELLVFGFDFWHHKPEFLVDSLRRLPLAEQQDVAKIALELSVNDRLRRIAEQVLSAEAVKEAQEGAKFD